MPKNQAEKTFQYTQSFPPLKNVWNTRRHFIRAILTFIATHYKEIHLNFSEPNLPQ